MRKRRLIMAACALALIAAAVTWWVWAGSLTAEERLLVGTWTYDPNTTNGHPWCQFGPDHRCYSEVAQPDGAMLMVEWKGRWFVREGALVMDGEANGIRRAFRPILRRMAIPHNGAYGLRINSITSDKVVVVNLNGTLLTLTRVSP
jgi:hypothetical protein